MGFPEKNTHLRVDIFKGPLLDLIIFWVMLFVDKIRKYIFTIYIGFKKHFSSSVSLVWRCHNNFYDSYIDSVYILM